MTYVFKDAEQVKTSIRALFAKFPELEVDEDFRIDVLEGETDLYAIVSKAINERAEAGTFAEAIKARETDLAARRARYEQRADAFRSLIKDLMNIAQVDKITLPEATISTVKARTSVDVFDVDALPQGYFQIERKADKTAIKAALEAGAELPGALLKTGEPTISIRVK